MKSHTNISEYFIFIDILGGDFRNRALHVSHLIRILDSQLNYHYIKIILTNVQIYIYLKLHK